MEASAKMIAPMDRTEIDLSALAAPFLAGDVEWRIVQSGQNAKGIWAKCVAYITARAIMERLDAVCGPENWQVRCEGAGDRLMTGIGIRVGTEWVWKWDGAGHLASNDGLSAADAGKGDFSNALKRAGVLWGIGRYLYKVPEDWANVHDAGRFYGRTKDRKPFHWDPPQLPAWARPKDDDTEATGVDMSDGPELISEKALADLEALIEEVKPDRGRFLAFLKVENLADLPANKVADAIRALEAKRAEAADK